jgi:hypothetical protein
MIFKRKSSKEQAQAAGTVRGEDWVSFKLKVGAPNHVAFGGRRFNGRFARAAEPFRATRGEWETFLNKTGHFEIIEPAAAAAAPNMEASHGSS